MLLFRGFIVISLSTAIALGQTVQMTGRVADSSQAVVPNVFLNDLLRDFDISRQPAGEANHH